MKTYSIARSDLVVSRLAYGSTGLVSWDQEGVTADDVTRAARLIDTVRAQGITLFDHADVYAFGKCEDVFGRVLRQSPGLREKIVLQSKCGQRFIEQRFGAPIFVDLGREHILRSVEASLKRLCTDYLDILLLHAPDALMEPDEVARAFDSLQASGKVRHFGVSNFNASQIALLAKTVRQPLVVNQIPISLARPEALIEDMATTARLAGGEGSRLQSAGASGGTIEYCRMHAIQIQAWSPLRGVATLSVDASPALKCVAMHLARLAQQKATTPAALALAWLLRHPAGIVPVLGGAEPRHLIENCEAERLSLSRREWYNLFAAAT